MRHATTLLLAGLLLVVGAHTSGAESKTTKLSLSVGGMSCERCSGHIKKTIGALDGVYSVTADHEKGRVIVVYRRKKISKKKIRQAITDLGYVIGKGDPKVVYPDGADIKVLSKKGEDVIVGRHLASGKITVVDFYADWCKPCKALDRRLAALVGKNLRRLAVRKVNIVTFDTPVAKRYLKKVAGLPYIRIYDTHGKFVVALSGDDVDRVGREINKIYTRK